MKRQNPQTSPRRGGRACLGVLSEFRARFALLQRGVFERLRCAQTHNCLGLNLDGLTGGGVAAHASLAVSFYCASDSGNNKFSRRLGFFYSQVKQLVKKRSDLFLGYRLVFRADLGRASSCANRE